MEVHFSTEYWEGVVCFIYYCTDVVWCVTVAVAKMARLMVGFKSARVSEPAS